MHCRRFPFFTDIFYNFCIPSRLKQKSEKRDALKLCFSDSRMYFAVAVTSAFVLTAFLRTFNNRSDSRLIISIPL